MFSLSFPHNSPRFFIHQPYRSSSYFGNHKRYSGPILLKNGLLFIDFVKRMTYNIFRGSKLGPKVNKERGGFQWLYTVIVGYQQEVKWMEIHLKLKKSKF